ncbi:NFX1-type zinc finger-containing protein 1-like [Spodoptera litura]|uniref:NFX1-type zinc finger-containing protein 1-like n=1 Tax=Spodoptera litura TaxID=69820 RepID=A0A9J7ET68_SPOLT|nr:NFX1-type zinc finger-containing protein 1-like [Spodoptera litura]
MEEDDAQPGPSNWRRRNGPRNPHHNWSAKRSMYSTTAFSHSTPNLLHNRSQTRQVHGQTRRERDHSSNRQQLIFNNARLVPAPGPGSAFNNAHQDRGPRPSANMEGSRGSNNTRFTRSNRGFQSNNNKRFLGFIALQEIAESEEKDVLQKINDKRDGFMNIINAPIEKNDVFVLVVGILSKVTQSPFVELKSKLLLDVCNSDFINKLQSYLVVLPFTTNKATNNLYWRDQSQFWKNLITFCGDIVDTSPATAIRRLKPLIEGVMKMCLESLHDKYGLVLSEDCIMKLDEIRQKMISYEDRYQSTSTGKGEGNTCEFADLQPPDNFRDLSVVPTKDDLLGSQPFLRANIVEGGYTDVEHYLDVQFRLLREDCFGPFRDGLHQFLEDPNRKKYDHIRVFHNVRFVCPYIDNLRTGALAQIDIKKNKNFRKINWKNSKRFLFGSLVLFTKDNFNTFMAATILNRDTNLLSSGKLPVSIIDVNLDDSIYNGEMYTMVESEVYFEPYYHVMKALQEPSFPQHLAMQQYIVKVAPGLNPPAYLTLNTKFEIPNNQLTPGKDTVVFTKSNDDIPFELDYYSDDSDKIDGRKDNQQLKKTFTVLQPNTWPTMEDLDLNKSQYEAYYLALTQEFAVIQGPPGTGKTFIAIKVAKTLLNNVQSNGQCLMLIICYTNHALDQFLEAISQVTRSIVRIGGQSRNKALDQFNLVNLRRSALAPSASASHRFFFEQKNLVRRSIYELQSALKTLDVINNGVLSYRYLNIPPLELLDAYYQDRGKEVEDPLEYWLFERLSTSHEYYRDLEDCLLEYETVVDTEEEIDDRRERMVLDDEKLVSDVLEQAKASFLLSNAKSEMRELVANYKKCTDINERYFLSSSIQNLDARINLFNDMVTYRHREVVLHINERTNFSEITIQNRWCLYFTWIRQKMDEVKEEIANLQAAVTPALTAYDEARMMVDVQLIKNKGTKVVGMTTSGAARMRKLLQTIAPKIVIVEEAAEVLEQHIITSLTKDCQHFILIGDHQQLRPSASHIKLAKRYNIEVSLFERMITNGIHSRRLNVQHRMRPEIAALISPHIYKDLANHPSVETFKNVPGVEKNVYFFTHDYQEHVINEGNSRENRKEGDMALALANYLMQQGFTSDDITILAAYSGQMFYMKKEREKYASLSRVKITVVDNYQGEESRIIILSLVRNNPDNQIGFLGTENRVCVALSRAKEGFYIFGNMNMLKAKSGLWREIATTLENNGSLGSQLIMKCQNHPEQRLKLSTPEDFERLPPEGGCYEKCNFQYHCGHKCLLYCHGYDREHVKTKCTMKCERVLCERGHVCPLKCRQDCEPCKVYIMKTLPCGHEMNVYCHREPEDPRNQCLTKVEVILPDCQHKAQVECYKDINKVKCLEPCKYRLEECGHVCGRKCHVTDDPNHESYVCTKPCARAKAGCTAELMGDRGDHQCRNKCHEKCDTCTVPVKKKRSTCKHMETVACNVDIDKMKCLNKCARMMTCGHYCKKICYEDCTDCSQMVWKEIPECKHKVKVKCMHTPDRSLCPEKCMRLLSCGHLCRDMCAVPCDSTKCTEITSQEVLSPCGHKVKLPCNMSKLYIKGELTTSAVLAACAAACGATLACGHVCGATCARCRQRRLHAPCTQPCNQDNICGHTCQEPCNQICPPCKRPCEVKCAHSKCNKLCGEQCTSCKEECMRACPHGRCARRCHEPCERSACDERCARRLRCGHMCRGLCGEPCPDICQICRPEQFPTDFLGDAYGDNDKFILLEDCGHILEVDDMDSLMLGDQENITIRTCPFCRKPIINTNRYKDIVNKRFKDDINPIKIRVYGTNDKISTKITELRRKMTTCFAKYVTDISKDEKLKTTYKNLENHVIKQKKVSLVQVEMECVYLNIFEMIVECWQQHHKQTTMFVDEMKENMNVLLDAISIKPTATLPVKISEQQQKDISNEIKRLNVITQFGKLLNTCQHMKNLPKVKQQIELTKTIVFSVSVFSEDKAIESLKTLQGIIKVSGEITKYERELIVKAIGLKAGHWYKCPNGHIYCIGECGGAMQVSTCPECKARIGGTSHALLPGNQHAPEMDGSKFAAWSEQNNLANFQLNF